ncbi:MAG: hypothetical protein F6K24_38855 [Okeania sp. SIO2D1]|nr:hypothetical protein [Okeania sp. SIO2D1]
MMALTHDKSLKIETERAYCFIDWELCHVCCEVAGNCGGGGVFLDGFEVLEGISAHELPAESYQSSRFVFTVACFNCRQ